MSKNILLNLPEAFHRASFLSGLRARLQALGNLRTTSHNTPEEIAGDLKWADAVIMWAWPYLSEELLRECAPLGYIGHIDLTRKMARAELAMQIPVSVSKGGWSPAVSEMALTLILAALRRTSNYHAEMWQGREKWAGALTLPEDVGAEERELSGRSVGIVGLGQVGQGLARLLAPFQVDLHVVDPFVPQEVIGRFGARRCDIDEMIAACEVVVLCAAANEGTGRLFNASRIAALRPGAVFVNVARAMLVDSDALLARLKIGNLFAAIDVFDEEPLPATSELRQLPNAYLTPHRAGGLHSSIIRTLDFLIGDLEEMEKGRPRRWALDESRVDSLDD